MTFGLALNQRRQLARKIIGRETQIQIISDMLMSQRAQRDLFAQIVSLHFEFIAFERMASPFHVLRPECADYQQALSANSLAEMSKQIDAGRIGPMNIFKQNYQRIVPCQLPERISHFAQHSFLSGADGLSLQ